MPGPLEGIRVVEFTEIIAGPVAGMFLSDLGADVVKVEPPWGDPWRYHDEVAPAECRAFIALNRGKRSITLDLTLPEGRAIAHRLAERADVVIVNHRPDVPVKLGIDYEALSALNPALIYCEATAYGRQGPDAARPGYDLIVQAGTGIMAAEGKMERGAPRAVSSSPYVDFSTGHSIVSGVCAALYHRGRSGRGQKIETSLLANALTLQTAAVTRIESIPSRTQEWEAGTLPALRRAEVSFEDIEGLYQEQRAIPTFQLYYRTFRTADWLIAVGCLSDRLRRRLMDVLGLHDRRLDPDYDPSKPVSPDYQNELLGELEALFLTKTTAAWLDLFEKAGVPAGPVRFAEAMLRDEQAIANGMVIEQEHPVVGTVRTVGPLTRMSETPPAPGRPSPALGQHTGEILSDLGYSGDEIAALRRVGALG